MLNTVYHRLPEPIKDRVRCGRIRTRMATARRLGMESYENLVAGLFEAREISVVIDVGAHNGSFGRMLRHVGYRGRILSFEPVHQHFELLRATRGRDRLWDIFPFALGDAERTQDIQVAQIGQFSSFLTTSRFSESVFGDKSEVVRAESVPIRRLETVLDEVFGVAPIPGPCFLKMDTQGYDLEVLAGAGDRLSEVVMLQSEISVRPLYEGSPRDIDSIETMRSRGFEIAGMFPVTRGSDHIVIEFDVIMVRPPVDHHHG